MEGNEHQRVDGHDHAEEADGQGIGGVLPHQGRGEGDEGLKHQEDGIDPDHRIIGMPGESQNMAVPPE